MPQKASSGTAASPPWNGHPKGSRAYGRILAGLSCAGVATFAQLYSTQAVLPLLAADLRVTAAEAALTISLATVGLAATVIPWSFLADRIGRVKAMMWGITAATVLGLLVPLSASFGMLLVLRLLEGMALGGIPAIAIAYLNEEVSKAHAALAAGSYVAGTTLGDFQGGSWPALSANSGGGGRQPWQFPCWRRLPPSPSLSWCPGPGVLFLPGPPDSGAPSGRSGATLGTSGCWPCMPRPS
ncbi:MFS transporter [Arthrobacter sp. FX8]|uniref:MFS transporter n=1 Tax=Arthrobacter sp. FX8 TaxID=2997335 RepID=UPI00227C94DC|nr:MFS transporter [Arthrobacter sp. FX8]WAJ31670.1 MFS transporter [Arthrobacter sp. FX8]